MSFDLLVAKFLMLSIDSGQKVVLEYANTLDQPHVFLTDKHASISCKCTYEALLGCGCPLTVQQNLLHASLVDLAQNLVESGVQASIVPSSLRIKGLQECCLRIEENGSQWRRRVHKQDDGKAYRIYSVCMWAVERRIWSGRSNFARRGLIVVGVL